MIQCEECVHDPLPDCRYCEELTWLHMFRLERGEEESPGCSDSGTQQILMEEEE